MFSKKTIKNISIALAAIFVLAFVAPILLNLFS